MRSLPAWSVEVWHSGHWRPYWGTVRTETDIQACAWVRRHLGRYQKMRVRCAIFDNDEWRVVLFNKAGQCRVKQKQR